MKKALVALLIILIILCCAAAVSAEEKSAGELVKIQMGFSPGRPKAGDEISVKILIKNISDEDFMDKMRLFDPDGKPVQDFSEPVMKAGEIVTWSGTWTVTEEQAEAEKIQYSVLFAYRGTEGEKQGRKINFTKGFEPTRETTPEPKEESTPEMTPEPTLRPEDRPQVFLYMVRRHNPGEGTVAIACIDEAGDLWMAEEADVKYPFREKDIQQMLRERRGMTLKTNLISGILRDVSRDAEWLRGLAEMAKVVTQAEGSPVKTGVDVDEVSVHAMRSDRMGNTESVLLGIDGSYVFENKDPNAQALYHFMWYTRPAFPYGYAAEGLAPHGFETVSVREFFGLEKVDAETAVISCVLTDCEAGPVEVKLTEADREKALALLDRGIIIGKENPWMVTGGTTCYEFHDAQGNYLGCIETYEQDSLAVGKDGMYRLSLLPRSTQNLTAQEKQLLHLKIGGIDYEIGKSTPRDLIRNGWPCGLEWDGTFSFQDPGMYSTIYVTTENGGLDEPIKSISCQWVPTVSVKYGGFDGEVEPEDENDMDTAWFISGYEAHRALYPEEDLADVQSVLEHWDEDEDEDDGWGGYWAPMELWIETLGKATEDMDNGTEVTVSMSDGYHLTIYTAASPVSLSLGDEQYIRLGPEPEDW